MIFRQWPLEMFYKLKKKFANIFWKFLYTSFCKLCEMQLKYLYAKIASIEQCCLLGVEAPKYKSNSCYQLDKERLDRRRGSDRETRVAAVHDPASALASGCAYPCSILVHAQCARPKKIASLMCRAVNRGSAGCWKRRPFAHQQRLAFR